MNYDKSSIITIYDGVTRDYEMNRTNGAGSYQGFFQQELLISERLAV